MKTQNLNIVYVDIDKLKFAEYNPRKADKKQCEQLKKSLEKFGFVDPVIVNSAPERENIIIGGHFRVKVAKDLGIDKVPVVYIDVPDIEKEKELNIRLNKNTGEWDWDLLANFDIDFLKDIGFKDSELSKFTDDNDFDLSLQSSEVEETIFEMKENLIKFPSKSKYGIPDLKPEMLYKNDKLSEINIIANSRCIDENKYNLFNYDKKRLAEGVDKKILAFYTYDDKFEVVWSESKRICEKILNDRWECVISPNWSMFADDPLALQIWSIFKSRYISRYFQEAGIKIIPDINFSTENSFEFCFDGLPDYIPVCSYQSQNLIIKKDFENALNGLNYFEKKFKFDVIIIYGGKKIYDKLSEKMKKKVILVETINERIRTQKNENQIKI